MDIYFNFPYTNSIILFIRFKKIFFWIVTAQIFPGIEKKKYIYAGWVLTNFWD